MDVVKVNYLNKYRKCNSDVTFDMLSQLEVTLDRFVQRYNLTKYSSVKHVVYFSSCDAEEVDQLCLVIPTEFYVSIYFTDRRSEIYTSILTITLKGHLLVSEI